MNTRDQTCEGCKFYNKSGKTCHRNPLNIQKVQAWKDYCWMREDAEPSNLPDFLKRLAEGKK